jgi:hypothetical protein
MLGVRRAGVTIALAALQEANVVELRRGSISIINRDKLLIVAGTAYGAPEAQYARLFATAAPNSLQTKSRHAPLN